MRCGSGQERATLSAHAQAVLGVCDALTAAGGTVISANTDETADPQIFAQSEAGELAFYFVRAETFAPEADTLATWVALAAKHGVSAYFMKGSVPSDAAAPQATKIR